MRAGEIIEGKDSKGSWQVVFALLVPYVALGRTLLYFDLGARAEEAPAKRWREQLPRRAATAEA